MDKKIAEVQEQLSSLRIELEEARKTINEFGASENEPFLPTDAGNAQDELTAQSSEILQIIPEQQKVVNHSMFNSTSQASNTDHEQDITVGSLVM